MSTIASTKSGPLFGLAVLILTSSVGCMTTPGHNQHTGRHIDPVSFSGFTDRPRQSIAIQAKHKTDGWITIASTRSGRNPVLYSGDEWYVWSRSVVIGGGFWTFEGFSNPDGDFSAEVRAVDYNSGEALYTFEKGFYSWFDADISLSDMWLEHGHGEKVTIYSDYVPET